MEGTFNSPCLARLLVEIAPTQQEMKFKKETSITETPLQRFKRLFELSRLKAEPTVVETEKPIWTFGCCLFEKFEQLRPELKKKKAIISCRTIRYIADGSHTILMNSVCYVKVFVIHKRNRMVTEMYKRYRFSAAKQTTLQWSEKSTPKLKKTIAVCNKSVDSAYKVLK